MLLGFLQLYCSELTTSSRHKYFNKANTNNICLLILTLNALRIHLGKFLTGQMQFVFSCKTSWELSFCPFWHQTSLVNKKSLTPNNINPTAKTNRHADDDWCNYEKIPKCCPSFLKFVDTVHKLCQLPKGVGKAWYILKRHDTKMQANSYKFIKFISRPVQSQGLL